MTGWIDYDVETLRMLWQAGETSRSIAVILGRTRSAIIGKLGRIGLLGNMTYAERLRRQRSGRKVILNETSVREIRSLGSRRLRRGELKVLCDKYGIGDSALHSARTGRSWKDVEVAA